MHVVDKIIDTYNAWRSTVSCW